MLAPVGDLGRAGLAGAMGFGMYHAASYLSYKSSKGMIGNVKAANYKQWATVQADFQRSRFWNKEYGGVLTKDGGIHRYSKSSRTYGGVNGESMAELGIDIDNVLLKYHTHHIKPGKIYSTDPFGNRLNPKNYVGKNIITGKAAQYHGGHDYGTPFNSLVVNRFDSSVNYNHFGSRHSFVMSSNFSPFSDGFLRFFFNFWY